MTTKICTKCGTEKEITQFQKLKKATSGVRAKKIKVDKHG